MPKIIRPEPTVNIISRLLYKYAVSGIFVLNPLESGIFFFQMFFMHHACADSRASCMHSSTFSKEAIHDRELQMLPLRLGVVCISKV